jgi:hypothetical protein
MHPGDQFFLVISTNQFLQCKVQYALLILLYTWDQFYIFMFLNLQKVN